MRRFTFWEKLGMWLVGLIFLIGIQFNKGFMIIEEGKAGIKMSGTTYVKAPMPPGYHFFIPWYDKVVIIPTKPIMINFSLSEGDNKDTLLLRFEPAITSPDELGNMIQTAISLEILPIVEMMPLMFGTDGTFETGFFKKVTQPFKGVIRDTIADFNANTIQGSRSEVKAKLISRTKIAFDKNAYFKLVNDSVNLKELMPSAAVRAQQEKVSLAQQDIAIKEKAAKATAAKATGDAEAARIAARGRADAVTIEATAQAKANKLVSQSLTQELIRYEEVVRWNGVRSRVDARGSNVTTMVSTEQK